MPEENQIHEQQQDEQLIVLSSESSSLIKSLWNSLQYSLDHIQATDKRGVTWVNDFQFIINVQIFSKYINISTNVIKSKLSNNGFMNLGKPSKEILDDFTITSSPGWDLYMKHRFNPNSEEDDLFD